VVLEGGVVGHPNLGPDLRNLMQELRHRDKDWDMLTLAFALPPKREWHRDGDDGTWPQETRRIELYTDETRRMSVVCG
jgi:hypothetical protein